MRNGERSFRRLALGKVLSGVAAVILLGALSGSGPIHGQIAPDGYITSNNWLALGPFSNPAGVACSGSNDPLLANFIAPSFIHCQYPVEGDTIDYDPALAASDSYNGPTDPGSGKPMWRVFNDGTDDNDLDMEIDAGSVGSPDDLICTFVATYFQYLGAASLDAELCVGSDDGVQVWLDDGLVHNNGIACRPRGPCDDRVPVTITPGTHRIIMG